MIAMNELESEYAEFRKKMHDIEELADEAHEMVDYEHTPALEGIATMAMELRMAAQPEDFEDD